MALSHAPHWTTIEWAEHIRELELASRRVRYVDYGVGPPLVLVHGLGGSWQSWLENIPALGQDHRVIAIDIPGFGASETLPPGTPFDGYVAVLAALIERLDLTDLTLVGHSMGGLLSGRYAASQPQRLRGLALVSAGGIALSPARLKLIVRGFLVFNSFFSRPGVIRAFTRRPRLRGLLLFAILDDGRSLSGAMAAEVLPLMAAPGFADAVVAAGEAAADSRFEQVAVKTVLLWGRGDRILPLAEAARLTARMPQARLEVFDRAGHCPMFELPEDFNSSLAAFVAASAPIQPTPTAPTGRW